MRFNVGVGEVFIIAGQSNAQGLPNTSAWGYPNEVHVATPDPILDAVRVQPNIFNEAQFLGAENPNSPLYTNESYRIASFTFPIKRPVLSYLKSGREAKDNPNSGISPLGSSLWFWALLGEKLAERYKIPIAFFNAAWGGTTITQWAESTDPNARPYGHPAAPKESDGNPGRYQPGAPYGYLRNTLKFYTSIYGARAILWEQGETDTEALNSSNWNGGGINRSVSSQDDYRNKLLKIIDQSRSELSSNISWVIARTSKNDIITSDLVKNAQNAAIQSRTGLYYGPETDNIDPSRRSFANDKTHFSRSGLADLAQAWFNSIDQSGILNSGGSIPVTPSSLNTEPQMVQFNANGTTSAPGGGSQYMWVYDNGTADLNSPICYDQSIPTNCTGTRRAIIQNSQGNYILTQAVSFPYNVVNDTNDGSTGSAPLATGCYTLKAKHSNKFLQVADGNAGTRIRQQDGNGSTNQIFKLEVVDGSLYRIISQFSNKVMDANGAGTGSGTTVNQHDWANSAQQKWRLEAYGDGTYKLVPSYSNALAADVEGPSQDNGAGLHLWSPYGGDSQRFYVQTSGCSGGTTPPPTNPTTGSLSGCYVIRSVQTNQLMEAISGNTVEQRGANGANNQIWKAETTSANQYRFVTQNGSGLAMSVNALNNGELLRLSASSGDTRQLWTLQDNGSGAYRINGGNGVTWDMKNYGNDPQLQLWGSTSEGFQNQRLFRFESTGCPSGTTNPPANPTNPPTGGCTPFADVCAGNSSEIRNVTISVAAEGDYTMTMSYKAWERAVNAIVRINGVARTVTCPQTSSSAYQTQSVGTVHLTAGNNTIGLSSGTDGGIICFNSLCVTGQGGTPNPPTNPPTGGGNLAIVTPAYNCNTGNLTVATSGGNGTTIEYQVPGLGTWTTNPTFTVPSWQRTGTTFTLQVRQSGTEASPYSFQTACSGGRLSAISSSEPAERLWVNPNPTDGLTRVRFTLDKGKEATLSVVAVDGRTVYAKPVAGTGDEQAVSIDLSQQADGLYLIRLSNGTINQTAKLLLQH
ncbi:RICIN domain-containing protein [Larkinella sp. C7]|uniref:RICIN domain-containing protein n=1 Tax=Larkinella sp. C7 TaxID=2576607 RepID=UPI0027B9BF64|nr:RICIN domain-containing protein [Larkinella sp. C7]